MVSNKDAMAEHNFKWEKKKKRVWSSSDSDLRQSAPPSSPDATWNLKILGHVIPALSPETKKATSDQEENDEHLQLKKA